MSFDGNDTQLEVLIDIREEMRSLSAELARIDERSRANNDEITRLREERVIPVENKADNNENRSKRNAIAVSAGVTTSIIVGTWALGVLPL